jgi:pilus assembly protein CpaD
MAMQTTPKIALHVLTAAALLLTIGGCESLSDRDSARLDRTDRTNVAERYPVGAVLERTSIDIHGFTGHGPASTTAYFNATRFVRQYVRDGRGRLNVVTPSRGGQRDAAMVRRVIQATGVAAELVNMRTRSDGHSAVTLSYERIAAVAPDSCYDASPLSERRPDRETGTAFGCATQRNLAHMVADPSDLVLATPEADRGSDRRPAVANDYRTYKSDRNAIDNKK